jgi:hypothetical protein
MSTTSSKKRFERWDQLQDLLEDIFLLCIVTICYVSNDKHTIMRIHLHFRQVRHIVSFFWILFQAGQKHGREVSIRVDGKRDPTRCLEVRLESRGPVYKKDEYMHNM